MVADSYSARLGLIEMGTGNNNNNWGTIFNASFADLLDRAMWGVDTRAVTGGALNLSSGTLPPLGPSPVAGAIQAFTGVLTSDETVTFPSLQGRWTIFNNTTGAFSLLLKTSGMATPIQIPQGAFVDVICDGTTLYRKDGNQVGRAIYHAGNSVPAGALEMTGPSLLRASFPDLFTAIGTTYGSVDGTHFTLPDTYTVGRFIRSRTVSVTIGTAQANQNKSHTHGVSGAGTTGIESNDHAHSFSGTTGNDSPDHTHQYTAPNVVVGIGGGGGTFVNGGVPATSGGASTRHTHPFSGSTSGANADHTHPFSFSVTSAGGSADGTEARPESLVMMACILY